MGQCKAHSTGESFGITGRWPARLCQERHGCAGIGTGRGLSPGAGHSRGRPASPASCYRVRVTTASVHRLFLAVVLAVGVAGILTACGTDPTVTDETAPRSVVEHTWALADWVLVVEVQEVRWIAETRGDLASGGYAEYLVSAVVVEGLDAVSSPLEGAIQYRYTEEIDPNRRPYVQAGRDYLVFLKRTASGELWPVAEAAQFLMTPELDRMVREITHARARQSFIASVHATPEGPATSSHLAPVVEVVKL
jgi:hypothetical protein